jgi:hypothetical protein
LLLLLLLLMMVVMLLILASYAVVLMLSRLLISWGIHCFAAGPAEQTDYNGTVSQEECNGEKNVTRL